MSGGLVSLRDKWIKKRLLPLYQRKNPLMATYDIKGIRFLAIDNSTYEINNDQLNFFKENCSPINFNGMLLVLLSYQYWTQKKVIE